MNLFEKWCDPDKHVVERKRYWKYTEKDGGRDEVADDLAITIRSHYDKLERIAEDIEYLGYEGAAETLREKMPQSPNIRSGDFGEILATELVEEEIGFCVPVRRLRYKDARDMAMRGDDFIGVDYCSEKENLRLLKGEAKVRLRLDRSTVQSARTALNRDHGRCTPHSLLFIADRLQDSNNVQEQELGRILRNEVSTKALSPDCIGHMLFTVSGNGPHNSLNRDFESVGTDRDHYIVNVHIMDHQEFIDHMYEEAEDLADT